MPTSQGMLRGGGGPHVRNEVYRRTNQEPRSMGHFDQVSSTFWPFFFFGVEPRIETCGEGCSPVSHRMHSWRLACTCPLKLRYQVLLLEVGTYSVFCTWYKLLQPYPLTQLLVPVRVLAAYTYMHACAHAFTPACTRTRTACLLVLRVPTYEYSYEYPAYVRLSIYLLRSAVTRTCYQQ